MAECDTVETVTEKVTIEQLLNTMPPDLRIWVVERKPKMARGAGGLADDYLQAWRQEPGVYAARTTQEIKRKERSAVETRKCHGCGQEGHVVRNCPKRGTETPTREAVTAKRGKAKQVWEEGRYGDALP